MLRKISALALGGLFVASSFSASSSAEIVLKAGSFITPRSMVGELFEEFVAKINNNNKGAIRIDIRAGPAAIPPFQLTKALESGVVDMANLPPGYYGGTLPEADVMKLSDISPIEMRKNGAWELLNKLHNERLNAYLLAQYLYGTGFHIYLNKKIQKPDLSGLKIRTTPTYRDFLLAMGARVVRMPHAELYTALERGVVDGYAFPVWELKELGFLKATKYRIDPKFYQNGLNILINLKTWNKLTEKQKGILQGAGEELERDMLRRVKAIDDKEYAKQKSGGVIAIEFRGKEKNAYLDAAKKAGWAAIIKRAPETGNQLRRLLTKN